MFDRLEMAPPDPILGLEEAFKRDPNPDKINLGAGVYKDESGITPIFRAVKRAEEFILRNEASKSYLGITGTPEFADAVQRIIFGADHPAVKGLRLATAHTPGGTGALRVAAEFVKKARPDATVWVSQPTWPNHPGIMRAAGLNVKTYPYFDAAANGLAFDGLLAALGQVPAGDIVVLHGSCHNPSGSDPTPEQWACIADVLAERSVVPLVDFAYQGFGSGLTEDARGLHTLVDRLPEVLVASSYSKNFGLYNERVGALTLASTSQQAAETALSQIKTVIRTNYSNPPAHGAKIVSTILNSDELRDDWKAELQEVRSRIHGMRHALTDGLAACGVARDYSFMTRQNGMFSFTGLTVDQVRALRERFAVYMVDSGRMNVAGLTKANLPVVCRSIAAVL